jgi:hypothetical protein
MANLLGAPGTHLKGVDASITTACAPTALSIKNLAQPRFVLAFAIVTVTVVGIDKIGLPGRVRLGVDRLRGCRLGLTHAAFNQFVEFATVQPNPTALGAVVDFHPLAVCHDQGNVAAMGAFHVQLLKKMAPVC